MNTISKILTKSALLASLFFAPSAFAQMSGHSGHDMNRMIEMRQSHMVEALGTVMSVDVNGQTINLAHDAIAEVNWPAMKMDFRIPPSIDLTGLRPGDKVQFTLHRAADGRLPLVELCKTSLTVVQPALCAPMTMGQHQNHDRGSSHPPAANDHSKHKGH